MRSSVAQMNEFFLDPQGDDAKQYTLCHGKFICAGCIDWGAVSYVSSRCLRLQELGHSFGLAHTDEIFGNPDLGNCLDYTNNFAVNKHPDVSNYETLVGMYGEAGGRRHRKLRGKSHQPDSDIPSHIWGKVHHSVQSLASRLDDKAHEDGWKLLHRSQHGEEHELALDEGIKVRVHMLLANNDD